MGRRGRPPYPDILTPREWEVLALLREGLTNEAIAARLGISHAAAKYHVSEILSKLGVASREEAAAWQPEEERRRWGAALAWLRPATLGKAALVAAAVAVLAGLGLLAWGVSKSNSTSEGTGPTTSGPAAQFPSGFVDFARRLSHAVASADISFFGKSVLFQDWDCGGQSLPAAGPQCGPAEPGTGVPGIAIGVDGSEGSIEDASSLGRWMFEWLHKVEDDDFADEYGPGSPRVWAVAKADPEIFGGEPGQELYAIIATKVWPATERAPVTRTSLVFFVVPRSNAWLVSRLLVSGTTFLDRDDADTRRLFSPYVLWEDVLGPDETMLPWNPGSGWESPRAVRKVAFLDSSARLWVGNADGSGRREVSRQVCREGRFEFAEVSWSPPGDRIGVRCPGVDGEPVLEAYSAADGTLIGMVTGVYDYRWSPDGNKVAYQTASVGATPPPQVRIADLSGADVLVADDAVVLDWTAKGVLVGDHPQVDPPAYSAVWYDPDTGATSPALEFDDGAPVWFAFDGKTVVLGTRSGFLKSDIEFAIEVLDLDTGKRTPINGLIAFPNAVIPRRAVAINANEAANQLFWIYAPDGQRMSIWSADLDGARVTYLGTIDGYLVDLSWDGLLLYTPASGPLTVRDLISGAETEISDTRIGAIRPPQPEDPRH